MDAVFGDLMAHRVLPVDHGDARGVEPGHGAVPVVNRDRRIGGAVLHEDRRRRREVVLQALPLRQETAHGQKPGRPGPVAAPQAQRQREGTALGEAGHDRR